MISTIKTNNSMNIKNYTYSFIVYILQPIIMAIPSHYLRLVFLKCIRMKIGQNSYILRNVEILSPSNIELGNNCAINSHTLLDGRGGKIIIKNNVDIAREVNIWTLEHDPHDDYHRTKGGNVIIENNVWVASRVTILPNITIGEGAVIASGAVVTKDVPPMCIVGGIPAKVLGKRKSNLLYKINYAPLFR